MRVLIPLVFALAAAGCATAAEKAAPAPKAPVKVYAIESYELVCRESGPTIVAVLVTNSLGWTGATAAFPGGPPVDGVLTYEALAVPPDGPAAATKAQHKIEVPAVITKGTTHIKLVSELNEIVQPHPPGC